MLFCFFPLWTRADDGRSFQPSERAAGCDEVRLAPYSVLSCSGFFENRFAAIRLRCFLSASSYPPSGLIFLCHSRFLGPKGLPRLFPSRRQTRRFDVLLPHLLSGHCRARHLYLPPSPSLCSLRERFWRGFCHRPPWVHFVTAWCSRRCASPLSFLARCSG